MARPTALDRVKKALKIDEGKLDKYLSYYYENKELDDAGKEMLAKYRMAFSLMSLGRTDQMVINALMKDYDIQERQARYIISEASFIYGRVQVADRQGKKIASANYYRLLANLAQQNGDIDAATKAWEKADRLEGLLDAETLGRDPDDFLKAAKIVFTNNVNVLIQGQQKRMAEDE
ncbi:hypothetical protein [Siphonobacter sp. SORGH_AS_1065]|uniref:hypothetical protein n=1 Tax=Siphonobacter sp. SORGH_AS_1065 TaxID=3041795 RepID=UPI0027853030|nr:hypothetical protein [Siphonobacter sp. SORGH_AS_1065]MDQ1088998.1 tetratricopeptide (TPR) repeat protein [Siphonobacter sp. SORGH_AS_1065]